MGRRILHKRGLKANLPRLDEAEFALTTDDKKVHIGTKDGNIQLMDQTDKQEISRQLADTENQITNKADKEQLTTMASKDYVTEKIIEVNTGGTGDISSKASVTYVDEMNGINNFTTVPIRENGAVVAIEERQGSKVVSRTAINRNSDGEVISTSKTINGKTVISRYNKENGQLVSISKTLGGNE